MRRPLAGKVSAPRRGVREGDPGSDASARMGRGDGVRVMRCFVGRRLIGLPEAVGNTAGSRGVPTGGIRADARGVGEPRSRLRVLRRCLGVVISTECKTVRGVPIRPPMRVGVVGRFFEVSSNSSSDDDSSESDGDGNLLARKAGLGDDGLGGSAGPALRLLRVFGALVAAGAFDSVINLEDEAVRTVFSSSSASIASFARRARFGLELSAISLTSSSGFIAGLACVTTSIGIRSNFRSALDAP